MPKNCLGRGRGRAGFRVGPRTGTLAQIGYPERFGWGLSWVMEGSEKSTGRFALGVGVARVSGGLPKTYLKVAEVFGELVVEL